MSKKIIENFKNRRRDEQPDISKAEHRANCDSVVEMLLNVMERLPEDLPNDESETIDDLMNQLRNPTQPPVIVQHHTGKRLEFKDGVITEIGESAPIEASTIVRDV